MDKVTDFLFGFTLSVLAGLVVVLVCVLMNPEQLPVIWEWVTWGTSDSVDVFSGSAILDVSQVEMR